MSLKSLDIVILLKLVALDDRPWTYVSLSRDLFVSLSVVFQGVFRVIESGLLNPRTRKPRKRALEEFLIHGVKYVFPSKRGGLVRGTPTSYAAPPLNSEIIQSTEHPPVWPYEQGKVRGYSFSPLHECVPRAAEIDPELYELLALLDAIRGGRTRESLIAITKMRERMGLLAARKITSNIRRLMANK
jgi:hypothetical protein